MKNKFIVFYLTVFSAACSGAYVIEPPRFAYSEMYPAYFRQNPGGHLPLTVQEGVSLHPYVSGNYLFYASTAGGSSDIWLRNLENTVNIPVVRHSSRQHSPAFHPLHNRLVYVTEERNPAGSLNIVRISPEPEQLFFSALRGRTPPNLKTASENLSEEIHKYFKDIPGCSLPSADRSPVWSPDGSGIYYLSDRCQPGKTDLWFVRLNRLRPLEAPVRITYSGADQFALSGDGFTAVTLAFTPSHRAGRFSLIRNITDSTRKELPLSLPDPESPLNLYLFPALDTKGENLYYIAVRRDADGNGRADPSDPGGIFRVNLNKPDEEIQILESTQPLYSLHYSDFESGALLYSASLGKTVNIHYIHKDGIIPIKDNIREQFESASVFRSAGPERYLLALFSVKRFFSDKPEFGLYESRILQEIRSFFSGDLRQAGLSYFNKNAAENPLRNMDQELAALPAEKQKSVFLKYLKILENSNSDIRNRSLHAALSERYIVYLYNLRNYAAAARETAAFRKSYPDYPNLNFLISLQGLSELYLNGRFSETLISFYGLHGTSFADRDRTTDSVWNYLQNHSDPRAAAAAIADKDLPSDLRKVLQLAEAENYFKKGDLISSNRLLHSVLEGTEHGSALFIRALRLRALIYERLGNPSAAEAVRLLYGGSYRSDGAVTITIEEFRDIIENTENSMNRYLRTARSLNSTINAEIAKQDTLVMKTVNTSVLTDYSDLRIPLNPADRDTLAFFCSPESNTLDIIMRTGQPRYVQSLNQLCMKNKEYFSGTSSGLPTVRDTETAADLLYLSSYIQANLLNILFLNIRKTGQFDDFYNRYSVKYHRMKADIAMERNRILLESGRRKTALISAKNLRNLVTEADPFDAATFNEILHGYKMASEEARKFRDLSLMYGYAYTLIHKSVEREFFYDQLQKEGTVFSESTLKDKKNAVLADFKRAEHQLQYILYTDPSYTDAYLLLGWMYQYIDSRRSQRVFVRPGYGTRFVNWFFNVKERKETDGIYYYRNYSAYFPERLYETNVLLYESAASFDHAQRSAGEKAALNLNLANNYFILMNFGKAVEKYGKVKSALRHTAVFRNYQERALFHYHYGRSLYYENYHKEAASELKEAALLYETYELKPLTEKYNTSVFLAKEPSPYIAAKLAETHEKLYIIYALTGLAYHENGDYAESSVYLEKALSHFRPAFEKRRNVAGVYNQLAITLQQQSLFSRSDSSALKAAEVSLEKQLATDYERFIPETLGGRVLGYILGYNEDFFIIGEGRNPYGFSPLRHYELSTGIRLENLIRSGDFRKASALIARRMQIFTDYEKGTWLGRTAIVNSLNLSAYYYYLSGDFTASSLKFREAADLAQASGDLILYRKNTLNYYNALFAMLDSGSLRFNTAIGIINDETAALSAFRKSYREKYKEQYIYNRKTESPEFVYNPQTDDPVIEKNITADLFEFTGIEALLFYYRGLYYFTTAENESDIRKASSDAAASATLFENALATLSASERRTRPDAFNMQINLARASRLAGNLLRSRFILTELLETAEEYRYVTGQWNALYELALTEIAVYNHKGGKDSLIKAERYFSDAWNVLTGHPEIFSIIRNRYAGFYESMIRFHFLYGNTSLIPEIDETYWNHFLFTEFTKYSLPFERQDLTVAFREYTDALGELRSVRNFETGIRQSFRPFSEIMKKVRDAEQNLETKRKALMQLKPGLASFLKFPYKAGRLDPVLQKNQVLLKFRVQDDAVHLWTYFPAGKSYTKKNLSSDPHSLETSTAELLQQTLRKMQKDTEVIILPDPAVFELSWTDLWNKAGLTMPLPVFTTRLSDIFIPFYKSENDISSLHGMFHRFNISRITSVKNDSDLQSVSDIADFYGDDWENPDGLAGDSGFTYRGWIGSESTISVALLNVDRGPQRFRKSAYLYEIFRAGGAATSVVYDSSASELVRNFLNLRGSDRYQNCGLRTFGFPGFQKSALTKTLMSVSSQYIRRSYDSAAKGDYQNAYKNALNAASVSGSPDAYLVAHSWQILLSQGRMGTEEAENLVFTALQKGTLNKEGEGFRLYLSSLLRTGQLEKAQKHLNAIKESERNLLYLNAGLNLPSFYYYQKIDFYEVFQSALPEIRKNPFRAREIIQGLLNHGRHNEIRIISRLRPEYANLIDPQLAETDYMLLFNKDTLPSRPLKSLPLSGQPERDSFRAALQNSYQELRDGRISNIILLKNINNIYSKTDLPERSLLFYVLLQGIADDPEFLSARMLGELIETELNLTGYDRAGIMAVNAAAFAASAGDIVTAEHFIKLYESYAEFMIQSTEIRALYQYAESMLRSEAVSTDAIADSLNRKNRTELIAARNYLLKKTEEYFSKKEWDNAFEACHLMHIIDLRIAGFAAAAANRNYAEKIRRILPDGQRFSALCAGSYSAYRITFTRTGTAADPMDKSEKFLRGRLKELLSAMDGTPFSRNLLEELRILYTPFYSGHPGSVGYIWMPGLHILAPNQPDQSASIFTVPDLDYFLKNPATNYGNEIGEGSAVRFEGRTGVSTFASMEKNIIAAFNEGREIQKKGPVHIAADSNALNHLKSTETFWFFTGSVYSVPVRAERNLIPGRIYQTAAYIKSPGIFRAFPVNSLTDLYFIKFFYDPAVGSSSMMRRLRIAYEQVRRLPGENGPYGYIAITPSVLKN